MKPVLTQKKKPRMSKHLMSDYLKSCKRIARFKQSRESFIDGCVPEFKVMTKPEMERLHKCRKHDEWQTSIKITVKRVRAKDAVEIEKVEIHDPEDGEYSEYKEWVEEQFWARM